MVRKRNLIHHPPALHQPRLEPLIVARGPQPRAVQRLDEDLELASIMPLRELAFRVLAIPAGRRREPGDVPLLEELLVDEHPPQRGRVQDRAQDVV